MSKTELVEFIGKDVRYDIRPDVVEGIRDVVLSEIVLPFSSYQESEVHIL